LWALASYSSYSLAKNKPSFSAQWALSLSNWLLNSEREKRTQFGSEIGISHAPWLTLVILTLLGGEIRRTKVGGQHWHKSSQDPISTSGLSGEVLSSQVTWVAEIGSHTRHKSSEIWSQQKKAGCGGTCLPL
jgi:hypothetical protein